MRDTSSQIFPDDSQPVTDPVGGPIIAYACIAASAICAGFAGALIVSAPRISTLLFILGAGLIAIAFRQIRQLASTTERLRNELVSAKQSSASDSATLSRMMGVVESISDGFVLLDEQGQLVLDNPRAGTTQSPDIKIGMSFDSYIRATYSRIDERSTGGDPEAWLNRRRTRFADANGSYEVLLKSGTWLLITERRTRRGERAIVYTDITERKEAEERRELSERRLAHAQKLARIGIFEWDAAGSQMYWSDIMYEIVGLAPGSPPLDFTQYLSLVRAESRDLVRSTFRRLLTTGGKYNQEHEIVRPDGEIRSVRTEAEAVTDEQGEIIRILGSVHDQTGAKRIETVLRKAKETAIEANKAKSEFLANVSHELRTPLNAIIGFSEVMIQEVFGPVGSDRYRDYAGDIRQSGVHLLGVINDLLDYSKLEAGRVELHMEEISLRQIVDKCVRMMRQEAQSKDVALTGDLPDLDDTVLGDEQKITQIVLNLISNAIKFTLPDGIVNVSLRVSGNGVDIVVSDSGIGMSPDDIELALSPFGQVDSTFNRQQTGTGLGLPLSKSLAELHGGTLKVASTPDEGTTIIVHLSRRPENADKAPELRLVMGGQAG
tara:strand:- start:8623 stop:10437 length:1815 start_codon:yes stop_codon:yes gene_type:complete